MKKGLDFGYLVEVIKKRKPSGKVLVERPNLNRRLPCLRIAHNPY